MAVEGMPECRRLSQSPRRLPLARGIPISALSQRKPLKPFLWWVRINVRTPALGCISSRQMTRQELARLASWPLPRLFSSFLPKKSSEGHRP